MLNFKRIAIVPFMLMLAACSLDSEKPIFMTADSDYIGDNLKIDGVIEKGKPAEGYLKPHPSADGNYYIVTNIPQKYDDRYMFKAIKRVEDGIIFAVQTDMASRFQLNAQTQKHNYEVYPVKISNSGVITIFEFLKNEKTDALAKKRKLQLMESSFSIRINGEFDRLSTQCYVQDLIDRHLYKPMSDKKTAPVTLIGYAAPGNIGVKDCD